MSVVVSRLIRLGIVLRGYVVINDCELKSVYSGNALHTYV